LAFDGDGDRLLAVDEKAQRLTGDQVLTVCAQFLKESGRLSNNVVVSTVMSNLGFRVALRDLGIEHVSTPVGDRNVVEEMRARKAILGGEDSGHLIFLGNHSTGDGLLSGLQLLSAMQALRRPLSELSTLMRVFPQTLLNVPVQRKPEIPSVPEVVEAITSVEARLGDRGRVLVRYSGTEPVCRIMVEGERQEEIERYASEIGKAIRRIMG
jgi:phosphoglucosamine mutase